MRKKIHGVVPYITIVFLAGFISCSKQKLSGMENKPMRPGFPVRVTDGPADYSALKTEIVDVQAYLEGNGWIDVDHSLQHFNVLALSNGRETHIAENAIVGTGHYSKLRIVFGENNMLTYPVSHPGMADTNITVQLKWDHPRIVQVPIDVTVNEKQGADLMLDIDVSRSVVKAGDDYFFRPVVHVLQDRRTGLRGRVNGTRSASVYVIQAQDTLSTCCDADGNFMVRGLDPGTYDMIIVPVKDPQHPNMAASHEMDDISVIKGSITELGIFRF
ncbi:MAG TPA: DUF4382 domain-containing protein [Bacteroidia bacterium]